MSENYPLTRQDKAAVQVKAANELTRARGMEQDEIPATSWKWYDSKLKSEDSNYLADQSTFDASFRTALPDRSKNIQSYIEHELSPQKGHAVGIEVGGPGSNLFAGFTPGFFRRTAGITLNDKRSMLEKARGAFKHHHTVITGNILEDGTKESVDHWLHGEKADLIIERMAGGLTSLPEDPYYITGLFADWYSKLAPNGILLAQVPEILNPLVSPLREHIEETSRGTLEVGTGTDLYWQTIRLHKLPGAPETLPLLDPRQVREAYKDAPYRKMIGELL